MGLNWALGQNGREKRCGYVGVTYINCVNYLKKENNNLKGISNSLKARCVA
jgi:hypothetical protein